jgi:DNA polymerase III epsilon subunit-like protein
MAKIWWFDLETTGLNDQTCGIVEIATIVQSPGTSKGMQWEALVNPGDVEIQQKALEVNGLTMEDVRTRRPIEEALREMDAQVTYRDMLAGHNVAGFDIPFLKKAYERAGLKWRFSHHCIDTMVLANSLKQMGLLDAKSVSLQALGEQFGFHQGQFGPAHRAMPDVRLTMAVFATIEDLLKKDVTYGF